MKALKIKRTPGFRFNLIDAVFLIFLGALSYLLFQIDDEGGFGFIPIYLGISFFCFCNIFRIGNKMEPFWYIPFTLITGYCIYEFDFDLYWQLVFWFLEPLKWVLIIFHIIKRPYHGIAYKRINRIKNQDSLSSKVEKS